MTCKAGDTYRPIVHILKVKKDKMQRLWKGVEVVKFNIGDEVKVKGVWSSEPQVIEEIDYEYDMSGLTSVYYLIDDKYYEENMLEPIEDPLVKKIEERNNKPADDKVNSPSHYTKGDIEVIDIIKQLTQGYEPFEAYLVGNTIKYLARANFKENKQQDLEKAEWHINKLIKE